MPPSIDVLTSSSAPAWPTVLMALKSPLPSPNVMVPKQSFETSRPVLPSVAYSMSWSFLVRVSQRAGGHWSDFPGLAGELLKGAPTLLGQERRGAPGAPRGKSVGGD